MPIDGRRKPRKRMVGPDGRPRPGRFKAEAWDVELPFENDSHLAGEGDTDDAETGG